MSSDWPIWKDCSFRKQLSERYEIRLSPEGTCAICDPESGFEITFLGYNPDGTENASKLSPAMRALCPVIFNTQLPDGAENMIGYLACMATGVKPPIGKDEFEKLTEIYDSIYDWEVK